jgi:hypothetical protein
LYKEIEVINGFLVEDGLRDQRLSGRYLTRIMNMSARREIILGVPIRRRVFLITIIVILVDYGAQIVAWNMNGCGMGRFVGEELDSRWLGWLFRSSVCGEACRMCRWGSPQMGRSSCGGCLTGMFSTQARTWESFEEKRFGRLGGQSARGGSRTPREDVKVAAMARRVVVEGIGRGQVVVAARTQGRHNRGSGGLLVQRGAALGAGEGAKEGHEAASMVSDDQSTFPRHIS